MKKKEIRAIYERDTPAAAARGLAGVIDHVVARLKAELAGGERVRAAFGFQSTRLTVKLHGLGKEARWAVLAVTDRRVVALLVPRRLLGQGPMSAPRLDGPDALEVASYPFTEFTSVEGRVTVTSFGLDRDVTLHRPDGSGVKIAGFARADSERVQAAIATALRAYRR